VFGIQVRGKSMMPYYLPGDTVVCSADRTARVGQDVVLIRHGLSEATLKRLDHFEPGKAVLRPLNASYRSTLVEISPEDRLYPVIGLWRIPPEPVAWAWELGEKAEAAEKKKKK
jgi:SOS-response transcriptional repressor LexA